MTITSDPTDTPTAMPKRFDDFSNARKFVDAYGDQMLHCYETNTWYVWSGTHWVPDRAQVERWAQQSLKSLWAVVAGEQHDADRRLLAQSAARSTSSKGLSSMLQAARVDERIQVQSKEFDTTPWLLNCANGTLDLQTGRLMEHQRSDLLDKVLDIDFDPEARCPHFLGYIHQTMGGDRGLISYTQRLTGYLLTGDVREDVLVVFYGRGSNGKTTLLEVLRGVLGPYARAANFDSFMKQSSGRVRSDIARLCGARLVTAVEADESRRLDEVLVKQLTGRDMVTTRFMYKDEFEYRPTYKLLLACNHLPEIRGTDYGMWRRLRVLPFLNTILKADKELGGKLNQERKGILAWMVQGCRQWQQEGLNEPQRVLEATNAYREEMDPVGNFLRECCLVREGIKILNKDLFAAYICWCERTGEVPLEVKAFGTRLREKGLEPSRANGYWRLGVMLQP